MWQHDAAALARQFHRGELKAGDEIGTKDIDEDGSTSSSAEPEEASAQQQPAAFFPDGESVDDLIDSLQSPDDADAKTAHAAQHSPRRQGQ